MILDISNNSGEKCLMCDEIYHEVYTVPDELWKRVTGYQKGEGTLCLSCFTKAAHRKDVPIFWEGGENDYISQSIKNKLLAIFGIDPIGKYCSPKCPKRSSDKLYFNDKEKVLGYINLLCGKSYRSAGNIIARLKEGRTVEELIKIASTKSRDPYFMRNNWQYFNPVTLYTRKNFDVYLNQEPEDFDKESNQESLSDWENRKTAELVTQSSKEKIKIGSMVDYYGIIGGTATSVGHKVLRISRKPNDFGVDVAWITRKEGCVSIASLTLSKSKE